MAESKHCAMAAVGDWEAVVVVNKEGVVDLKQARGGTGSSYLGSEYEIVIE